MFMMPPMISGKLALVAALALFTAQGAWGKLPAPAPLDDAGKAKAAEAAAKTAWSGKVDAYQLCMSMEKSAANYVKTATAAGKTPKAATATPPCADPGAFAFTSGAAAAPTAAAPAAPAAPAAAAPAAPAKKS
jgi:hypothetical protein